MFKVSRNWHILQITKMATAKPPFPIATGNHLQMGQLIILIPENLRPIAARMIIDTHCCLLI